ncbi:ImmA/IrrE family metallo-endopeptidase [Shewanella xiamenensis]|uniref:ImmA/IrrE family metallo-endopeptidase n=1 Tax=Shewanella xiamenensis TaxID=332186 RepID=UPI0035BB43AE
MGKHKDDEIMDLDFIDSSSSGTLSLAEVFFHVKENYASIPVKELIKRGLVESSTIPDVAAFFATNLSQASLYKKSQTKSQLSGSTWSTIVRHNAQASRMHGELGDYSPGSLGRKFFTKLTKLSTEPENILQVKSILAENGIALFYEPAIKNSGVDGVTGKLPDGTPYIGMSLRHSRLDNFWFTLLHELGHVVLHYDLLDEPIIDNFDEETGSPSESEIESEANHFALNHLIPLRTWKTSKVFFGKYSDKDTVVELAKQIGTHPAIVAGRVRKEFNDYRVHSDIVHQIDVKDIIWG